MTPSVSYGPALQRVIDEGMAATHAALLERMTVLEQALQVIHIASPHVEAQTLREIAGEALDGS